MRKDPIGYTGMVTERYRGLGIYCIGCIVVKLSKDVPVHSKGKRARVQRTLYRYNSNGFRILRGRRFVVQLLWVAG